MLAALERCAGRAPGAADQLLESDADGSAATTGGIVHDQLRDTGRGRPPHASGPLDGGANSSLLQPPGETLTRRDGLQVKAVAARSLRPGDLVALIDGQARQDLFGHVIDTLEESPDWGLTVALARCWQRVRAAHPGQRPDL